MSATSLVSSSLSSLLSTMALTTKQHEKNVGKWGLGYPRKGLSMSIIVLQSRVAEVVRGNGGTPKSLDSDENFKPEHQLFCRELRIVAIYALFGDLWAK